MGKVNYSEVEKFISDFTDKGRKKELIETFTCGYCFWMAKMLCDRFSYEYPTELMYDEVENHFGCRIGDVVYDATGDVTDCYEWVTWESMKLTDELLVGRIIRDCILKKEVEE